MGPDNSEWLLDINNLKKYVSIMIHIKQVLYYIISSLIIQKI